jgi:hypothetical protein
VNDENPTVVKWRAARSAEGADSARLERHKFTMSTRLPSRWGTVYPEGAKLAGELAEEWINKAGAWAHLFPKLECEPAPTRGSVVIRILSPVVLAGTFRVDLEHLARAIATEKLP